MDKAIASKKCIICDDRDATLDKWCEQCIKELLSIRIGERWKEIERKIKDG